MAEMIFAQFLGRMTATSVDAPDAFTVLPELILARVQELAAPVQALIDEGGPFVVAIFACGVVLWTLVLERWWYFRRVLPRQTREAVRAWESRSDHHSWCAHQIRTAMISRLNAAMNTNAPLLRVLVPLSPLLGLIGTVGGMLEVFDSMAMKGSADARAMASGVSEAMICTLTGLAVSISGLYPVYHFRSRTARETELIGDKLVY
ncbi:MAG TPA: MotA/TolQ/ExbB proton channel family protein [Candidatus Limnocylindrales bacterium]|nr:MotA/TolQ/ExbB proton channel family protein [Candidatus Limnocylindrales bacterium]